MSNSKASKVAATSRRRAWSRLTTDRRFGWRVLWMMRTIRRCACSYVLSGSEQPTPLAPP